MTEHAQGQHHAAQPPRPALSRSPAGRVTRPHGAGQSPAGESSPRADSGSGLHIRVVLVGSTRLEPMFAAEPWVELIRARSPLHAVGETSDRGHHGDTVVAFCGEGLTSLGAEDDIEAVRLVDPLARVIAIGPGAFAPEGLFDARIPETATPAEVRRVITELFREPQPANGARPHEAPEPAIVEALPRGEDMPTRRRLRADEPVGDAELANAMAAGRDPLPAAIALLKRRLGRDDIEFIPAAGEVPRARGGSVAVPVTLNAREAGHLVCVRSNAAASDAPALAATLTAHATWFAAWLRLSQQATALRRAAFTDPLTGAWNRRYCTRFLGAAIEKARLGRHALTVLYFDIDGFKQYNDRFGHAAGDEILVETVRALRAVIRPSDRVCRIGGDEFVVIFHEPDGPRHTDSRPPESVFVLTQRVQQKIREREFPKLGREAAGRLTISGGLATYPWDGGDATSLLQRADELAMQSKQQGKNAITLGPGAERVCERPEAGPSDW